MLLMYVFRTVKTHEMKDLLHMDSMVDLAAWQKVKVSTALGQPCALKSHIFLLQNVLKTHNKIVTCRVSPQHNVTFAAVHGYERSCNGNPEVIQYLEA